MCVRYVTEDATEAPANVSECHRRRENTLQRVVLSTDRISGERHVPDLSAMFELVKRTSRTRHNLLRHHASVIIIVVTAVLRASRLGWAQQLWTVLLESGVLLEWFTHFLCPPEHCDLLRITTTRIVATTVFNICRRKQALLANSLLFQYLKSQCNIKPNRNQLHPMIVKKLSSMMVKSDPPIMLKQLSSMMLKKLSPMMVNASSSMMVNKSSMMVKQLSSMIVKQLSPMVKQLSSMMMKRLYWGSWNSNFHWLSVQNAMVLKQLSSMNSGWAFNESEAVSHSWFQQHKTHATNTHAILSTFWSLQILSKVFPQVYTVVLSKVTYLLHE